MAYVARYAHDVFLSYAHNDDPAWIGAFEKSLRQELAERLGHPVSFWQDERKLRLGQDWPDEIEEAVKGAAVFLAIVSPSYRTSDWCGRERKHFIGQFPARGDMKVATKNGGLYRFLKIIKMPWPDDAHLEFFGEAQHVDFFERDDILHIADELVPGTESFQASMRKTAHALSSLLLAMRRMGETVFVATPAEDVASAERALYDELAAQGYDVQPEGPLDELFSDEAVRKEIEPAKLSIHLLGAMYDRGAERLATLSRDLEKPQVFWLSRDAEKTASEKQRSLIVWLSALGNGGPSTTVLTGPPSRMIEDVKQILVPRAEEIRPIASATGHASVYLICDPSSPSDAALGAELGSELRAKEGLEVLFPWTVTSRSMIEAHERKLRDCDGVLLYRSEAPDPWFLQHFADVMSAGQRGDRTKPLRAKAFVVDDPRLLRNVENVFPRKEPLALVEDLEPFLSLLRSGGGADARA
jgi:hypothetical protein